MNTNDLVTVPNCLPQHVEAANNLVAQLFGNRALRRWIQNGGTYTDQSFEKGNLQRSMVTGVTFDTCDFSDAAANGVAWTDNTFINCIFNRADFEFADMSRCKLRGTKNTGALPSIAGAGFNGVILRGSLITEIATRASSFAYADFSGAQIDNCDLNGTFEGCLFERAKISNTNFFDSNIEYCDFSNADYENVTIGLSELPYLFGIDTSIIGRGINVIAINEDVGIRRTFSAEEIAQSSRLLTTFYLDSGSYFAACNLTFLFGSHADLMPMFVNGIRSAMAMDDFRSLKLLCKLIGHVDKESGLFGPTELRKLYNMIISTISLASDQSIRNQFDIHDGQLRSYLISTNPNDLHVAFQSTSTNPKEANAVSARVINQIEDVLCAVGLHVTIIGSQFTFNSYPRHVIEIRLVRDQERNVATGPNWIDRTIAALTMLFTGLGAVAPLLADKPSAMPPQGVQQVIVQKHEEISLLVIPMTFEISKGGLPLTRWDEGNIILTNPSVETVRHIPTGKGNT